MTDSMTLFRADMLGQMEKAGMACSVRIGQMTPLQCLRLLRAAQAREKRQLELLWLGAVYTALALHAPERLPAVPWGTEDAACVMSAEEMKQNLSGGKRHDT